MIFFIKLLPFVTPLASGLAVQALYKKNITGAVVLGITTALCYLGLIAQLSL
jgi:hypothetical protein